MVGVRLSQKARHLLGLLAQPGASGRVDAMDESCVAISVVRGGVSVGAGSFALALVEQLQGHDLVAERRGVRGQRVFAITPVGEAYLRRLSASDDTAFFAQHHDLVESTMLVEGVREKVVLDAAEGPLDWLARRKDATGAPLIDAACFAAGERLRRDLTVAMMIPSVTTNWDASAIGKTSCGPRDVAAAGDASLAARQRVSQAMAAVGAEFAGLLIDLCGFAKGLATIEQERGWPSRSGKVVVRLALAHLADHYGLERQAQGPARSRGIRVWQDVVEERGSYG